MAFTAAFVKGRSKDCKTITGRIVPYALCLLSGILALAKAFRFHLKIFPHKSALVQYRPSPSHTRWRNIAVTLIDSERSIIKEFNSLAS
jgi:hypothetical protein